MPCTSAVAFSTSTAITPLRPETSRPVRLLSVRDRNRLEVRFASRTFWSAGMVSYDARNRSIACACCAHPWSRATTGPTLAPSERSGRGDPAQHPAEVTHVHRHTDAGEVPHGREVVVRDAVRV